MDKNIKRRLDNWVSKRYGWLQEQVSRNIAKGMMSEYSGDLLHTVVMDLYKLSDEKLDQMLTDDKLDNYILRGASIQLKSSNSPFYRKHRRFKMSVRSGAMEDYNPTYSPAIMDEEEDLMTCFERAQEELEWYHKALWDKKFKQGWTLTEIYKHFGIGKVHLIKDLNAAIDEIRKKCEHAKN